MPWSRKGELYSVGRVASSSGEPAATLRHEHWKLRPLACHDTLSGPCHGNNIHRSRMFVVGAVCSMIVYVQVLIISRPERASRLAMSIKAPIRRRISSRSPELIARRQCKQAVTSALVDHWWFRRSRRRWLCNAPLLQG